MQHVAWVVAPLGMAAILAFSAVTKLGKGESLRSIIANLRLPAWLLPAPLARAIPAIEIALAAGLCAPWLGVYAVAALGALILMLTYWALIARGLTITPRPSCGCFGAAGDHRISRWTLARNTLLVGAAGAGVALATSGSTLWALLGNADAGDALWLGLTAAACAVTALVFARSAEVRPAKIRPRVESSASEDGGQAEADVQPTPPGPAFAGLDVLPFAEGEFVRHRIPNLLLLDHDATLAPAGGTGLVTLRELATQRAQLLVFVNCYCQSTQDVTRAQRSWQERLPQLDVRVVFSIDFEGSRLGVSPERPLIDHAQVAWEGLGFTWSPGAILLGADGYVAGGPVNGIGEVAALVDDIAVELTGPAHVPEPTTSPISSGSPVSATGMDTGDEGVSDVR